MLVMWCHDGHSSRLCWRHLRAPELHLRFLVCGGDDFRWSAHQQDQRRISGGRGPNGAQKSFSLLAADWNTKNTKSHRTSMFESAVQRNVFVLVFWPQNKSHWTTSLKLNEEYFTNYSKDINQSIRRKSASSFCFDEFKGSWPTTQGWNRKLSSWHHTVAPPPLWCCDVKSSSQDFTLHRSLTAGSICSCQQPEVPPPLLWLVRLWSVISSEPSSNWFEMILLVDRVYIYSFFLIVLSTVHL